MKKALIYSVLISFFLFSCGDPKLTKRVEDLEKTVLEKNKQIEGLADLAIESYLNEMQVDSLSFEQINILRKHWSLPLVSTNCISTCSWNWRKENQVCFKESDKKERQKCLAAALDEKTRCIAECQQNPN